MNHVCRSQLVLAGGLITLINLVGETPASGTISECACTPPNNVYINNAFLAQLVEQPLNMREVPCSTQGERTNFMKLIIWNQKLGDVKCPYMRRWVLNFFNLFSIRLHHWMSGDDPRSHHDHPWSFIVIVLKGTYYDVTPTGREFMETFSVTCRDALHRHTVETNGCWTLLFTGPEKRAWGFFTTKKSGKEIWMKANRYFRKNGHHPCS